jgi:cytochrome c553
LVVDPQPKASNMPRSIAVSQASIPIARRLAVAGMLLVCAGAAAAVHAESTAQAEYRDVMQRTSDLERGRELFATCRACHSPDGSGISDGSVPAIAGQHLQVIVKQLVDFRHDRRWDIRMEHFTDRHHLQNAQDIADVAGYVHSLPVVNASVPGDGASIATGASAYFLHCESCHGPTGAGNAERLQPRLAGQHYGYLVRQLHDTGDGRRPNMSAAHVRVLRGMSVEEINGIADYLSRLGNYEAPPQH